MVLLGSSKNGTEMAVNEIAVNADRLVIITSVEPHYFAGYTGGRKSFLPGVASYQTIEQNHKLAMRSEAQAIALDGNPVHEDMMDALKVVKERRIFSIQVVLDRHQHVYKVAAGDLHASFEQAVRWANEVFSVKIKQKADVVVSIAQYPMDVDLYQSQKALDNGKWALKEGGTIILVSKCRDRGRRRGLLQAALPFPRPVPDTEEPGPGVQAGLSQGGQGGRDHDLGQDIRRDRPGPELLKKDQHPPFTRRPVRPWTRRWHDNPDAKVMVIMDGSVLVPRLVHR